MEEINLLLNGNRVLVWNDKKVLGRDDCIAEMYLISLNCPLKSG